MLLHTLQVVTSFIHKPPRFTPLTLLMLSAISSANGKYMI